MSSSLLTNLANAAASGAQALSSAVSALTPTQLTNLSGMLSGLTGETNVEKQAMALLDLYARNIANGNTAGAAAMQASILALAGLPNWFVDSLPGIWAAPNAAAVDSEISALQVKLDGNN